jgi:PKD repeat protein
LGDGTEITSNSPVTVSGISTAIAIAAGGNSEDGHSLAVLSDGSIKSWGYNLNGQLGDGTVISSSLPVDVGEISSAEDIAGGGSHSMALLSNGKIKCWGNNQDGQLGDGTNDESTTPEFVIGNDAPVASAGADITSGEAPLNVSFTGSATDSDGSIVSYHWNFSDGGTSSEQNPKHTFDNAGSFTVTLTVTDDDGATGSDSLTISVTEATDGNGDGEEEEENGGICGMIFILIPLLLLVGVVIRKD